MKFELASLALMNDDDQLAESILLEIVESARGESASMPLSIALVRLGTILTSRGELKEAAGRFQEALAISDKSGNTFMAADATYQLGQLELRSSNLPQAESWLRRNEKLQRGLGSKPGIANALLALGHVALARRQPPPGLDEALKIFRETGIRGGESAVLMAEGDGGMIMANYQDALTKFQEAREVYAAIGDKGGVANATLRIGHAHRERGELAEALEKYNQAAELYKEMPLPGGVANSMKFAGDMYRRQRDPGKAKTQYEAALQYSREHQEKAAEASCLFALGELFQEQKE